jgi:hypothetical protein
VNVKTIAGWAVLAFVVWWVIQQPGDARHVAENISNAIAAAAGWLSRFVASI